MVVGMIGKIKLMVAAIILVASSLYGQTAQEIIDSIVLAVQQGLILPFDNNECPEGWEEYTAAAGRFLIGAVPGKYDVGVPEGDYNHGHPNSSTSEWPGYADKKDDDCCDGHSSRSNHRHRLQISESEWLPPRVGVLFCRIEKRPAD